MRTIEPITHITRDERGIAWIGQTNVKVTEVVMDWMANHSGPEEMHRQFPHLSLAQIHAAMSYYHDHKRDLDAYIEETFNRAETLHTQSTDAPSRKELLARLDHS